MTSATATSLPTLRRTRDGRPAAPVRIVHLGVGSFFRAHAAWYTEHADDAADWGIAAFTGRSSAIADALQGQDTLYTLLVRGPSQTRAEVVSSLSAVHSGDDVAALRRYLSSADVAVVTLTVTEAGYRRGESGRLDVTDPEVRADVDRLRADRDATDVVTTPGRLVAGLLARRAAGAGPLAVVPCDNVSENGAMARSVVTDLADLVDPSLRAWIDEHVAFVTTMVDRITPRTSAADRTDVGELTGIDDAAVVVTEPFSEWVLSGDFPAGCPAWESAGAQFVDDVAPFETRKLSLLNGAHSLIAYAGSLLGYETVAQAVADPEVVEWLEGWWDDAAGFLTLPSDEVDRYRRALSDRFANPGIRHRLAQIGADGSQKIPIRVVPVLRSARAAGKPARGATRVVAAWVASLRGHGAPVQDVLADVVVPLAGGSPADAATAVLAWLGAQDDDVTALLATLVTDLESRSPR